MSEKAFSKLCGIKPSFMVTEKPGAMGLVIF